MSLANGKSQISHTIKTYKEKESPLQKKRVVQDKSFIHAARKANLSWQKFSTFVTRMSGRFRHAVNCLVQPKGAILIGYSCNGEGRALPVKLKEQAGIIWD